MIEIYLGIAVSVIIQAIKMFYSKVISEQWQTTATLGTLVILSLLVGWGVYMLKATNAWDAFYTVLTTASFIWAFVIKRFEK